MLDCEPFSIGSRDGFRHFMQSLSKRYVRCKQVNNILEAIRICSLGMIKSKFDDLSRTLGSPFAMHSLTCGPPEIAIMLSAA